MLFVSNYFCFQVLDLSESILLFHGLVTDLFL